LNACWLRTPREAALAAGGVSGAAVLRVATRALRLGQRSGGSAVARLHEDVREAAAPVSAAATGETKEADEVQEVPVVPEMTAARKARS